MVKAQPALLSTVQINCPESNSNHIHPAAINPYVIAASRAANNTGTGEQPSFRNTKHLPPPLYQIRIFSSGKNEELPINTYRQKRILPPVPRLDEIVPVTFFLRIGSWGADQSGTSMNMGWVRLTRGSLRGSEDNSNSNGNKLWMGSGMWPTARCLGGG
ncbi:hypothetical protein TcasGA2_TC008751 [Tribolium castaneum]|uniref:Uncharacterized protein n=1 Tax=Tribolium castaneum TaxID=7070 RepID=D6WS60_TRICA|nr:hypothetical protein TcasGA2_TC008751 [Tribolium castaneum]